MGFVTVNIFNVDSRQFEPLLINAAFIIKARKWSDEKGTINVIQLAPDGDWRAMKETPDQLDVLIGSIHDPDYPKLKELERVFSRKS
jgi:hypothetical protein